MKVFVLGATGYVGKFVLKELLRRNYDVTLLMHKRKILEGINVNIVEGNALDLNSYSKNLVEADAIINLIGIIKEKGNEITFEKMHFEIPKKIIDFLESENLVKKYIQMSALGAQYIEISEYFRTKKKAEDYIQNSNQNWTIFRPSIIWSKESEFRKQLIDLIKIPFFTPILGKGQNKFQLIQAEKAAEEFVNAIEDFDYSNKIIELGGEKISTFEEIISNLEKEELGKTKFHLKIPMFIMDSAIKVATKLRLPFPITYDQFKMLKIDNIKSTNK